MSPKILIRCIATLIIFASDVEDVVSQQSMSIAKGAMLNCQLPKNGTLMLSGGAAPTADMIQVLKSIPGDDLVYIPASWEHTETESAKLRATWKDRGFANVTFLHAESRETAEQPEFAKPLQKATRVFLSGGKQEVLGTRYKGTKVAEELCAVLDRGGIVFGTSAGMAIIPDKAIYDDRVVDGKREVIEGQGFGIFPGLVDTHYGQRKRFDRMQFMRERYQDLPGLGVDATAAVVLRFYDDRIEGEILGESSVYLYPPYSSGPKDERVLKKGAERIVFSLR